jgi:hypothetical protein
MKRTLHAIALLGLLGFTIGTTGCAMCSSCLDDTYAAYGGKWQRADPVQGRVGSAFDPAGTTLAGVAYEDSQESADPYYGESILRSPEASSDANLDAPPSLDSFTEP